MNGEALEISKQLASIEAQQISPVRAQLVDALHGALTPTGDKFETLRRERSERKFNNAFISAFGKLLFDKQVVLGDFSIRSPETIPAVLANNIWVCDNPKESSLMSRVNYGRRIIPRFYSHLILGSATSSEQGKSNILLNGVGSRTLSVFTLPKEQFSSLQQVRDTAGVVSTQDETYKITPSEIEKRFDHLTGKITVDVHLPGSIRDRYYSNARMFRGLFGNDPDSIRKYGLNLTSDTKETVALENGPTNEQIKRYSVLESLSRLAIDFGIEEKYLKLHNAAIRVLSQVVEETASYSSFEIEEKLMTQMRSRD